MLQSIAHGNNSRCCLEVGVSRDRGAEGSSCVISKSQLFFAFSTTTAMISVHHYIPPSVSFCPQRGWADMTSCWEMLFDSLALLFCSVGEEPGAPATRFRGSVSACREGQEFGTLKVVFVLRLDLRCHWLKQRGVLEGP